MAAPTLEAKHHAAADTGGPTIHTAPSVDARSRAAQRGGGGGSNSAHKVVSPSGSVKYRTTRSTVFAGSSFLAPVVVDGGSKVKYFFQTEHGDISFGVREVDGGGGFVREIIPESRVASHKTVVEGGFDVPKDANLVFVWDNSYSWLTDKAVVYSIEVQGATAAGGDSEGDDLESLRSGYSASRATALACQQQYTTTVADKARLDAEIAALEGRRDLMAASLPGLVHALSDAQLAAIVAGQSLRGALFNKFPRSVRELLFAYSDSVDLVAWRRVSKSFLCSQQCLPDFWQQLCLTRFGVFDHDGVFAAADEDGRGKAAVALDLFAIRTQQQLISSGDLRSPLASRGGSRYGEEEDGSEGSDTSSGEEEE